MLHVTIPVIAALLAGALTVPTAPTVDWAECEADRTADCATVRMPVDWARPGGEKFDLAVLRRPATDPARRIGVLLVNPGGPGDSGVNFVRDKPEYFSPEIRARFDIVGFDPRGIGQSKPVRCSADVLARQPSPYPRDQAEFDALAAYNRELRADCRRHSGPIFDHADTLSVVHDMDALRRALGERRISYFGHSYGTLIGEQYAERYGDRLRATVLTASIDHSIGTREFLESSAATAEDSFREFVAWCDRDASCALHGKDVTAVWDSVVARAADPGAVVRRAVNAFKGPDWHELAEWLASGSSQALVAETRPNPFLAVFCQDWAFRVRNHAELARLTAAELRQAPHMRGSIAHGPIAGCIGWPAPKNPQHRLRITDAPPILLLNARHDPVSAHGWVANVHQQARGATTLVTYEGWGHNVYRRNECTIGAVDRYLVDLTRPTASTCPA